MRKLQILVNFFIFLFFFEKISKKKVAKYKQEYLTMKEEQELKEDPVERLTVRRNA